MLVNIKTKQKREEAKRAKKIVSFVVFSQILKSVECGWVTHPRRKD